MCCFLTCVAFIDADTMEIPDGLNLAILIAGVIAVFTTDYCTWYAHVLGLLVISVPMLIIALIIDYYRSRGRERRMKKEAKEIALRKTINKEQK